MKAFVGIFIAVFWLYACVCVKPEPTTDPFTDKEWRFVPQPEIELDPDGCCIEKSSPFPIPGKGPHLITFDDHVNPLIGWEIEEYVVIDQWGDVVLHIPPNKTGTYLAKVEKGCYRLRAIGRGSRRNVPSAETPEVCTPGLTVGRIWS